MLKMENWTELSNINVEEIVNFYDNVLDKDTEFNPEIFSNINRYGFKINDDTHKHESEQIENQKKLDQRRRTKWLKMLKNWEQFEVSQKLRQRVFKSIPLVFRTYIWPKLLNSDKLEQKYRGLYNHIVRIAKVYVKPSIIQQIHLDIPRALTGHPQFQNFSKMHVYLFNIMLAYAFFDVRTSYCQGMCTLGAILLLHLPEECTFWAFVTLTMGDRYQLQGYYYAGFPKLFTIGTQIEKQLSKMNHKLFKHIIDVNVSIKDMLLVKWAFTLFEGTFRHTFLLRIWDIYFMYGEQVIIYVATLIFVQNKEKLLASNFEELLNFFYSYKNVMFDEEEFIFKLKELLLSQKIETMRLSCDFCTDEVCLLVERFLKEYPTAARHSQSCKSINKPKSFNHSKSHKFDLNNRTMDYPPTRDIFSNHIQVTPYENDKKRLTSCQEIFDHSSMSKISESTHDKYKTDTYTTDSTKNT
ncbi:TBC domain-containing protein [Intoshia linei]|uniref:TBC domain-containing protein n=1 Tax=Intoshia linei TaxID=1819745 RepID=A0A177AWZ4_9BILA|nr:TBC domain-containing protein [Intoshia linei]